MKKISVWLGNLKLRYKLLISYLLLAIVPLVVIFAYFQIKFVNKLERRTLDMEKVIVEQVVFSIENYVNQMESLASGIVQSEEIQQLLSCSARQLEIMWDQEEQKNSLLTYLENIRGQSKNKMISEVRIYCDSKHPLFQKSELQEYGLFESTEKISTSLWYGNMQEKGMDTIMASAFYQNYWEGQSGDRIAYIHKITYCVGNREKNAYVAVYFKRSYLEDVLKRYGNYHNSCIYIMDEKECVVAHQGQDAYGAFVLSYQDIDRMIPVENEFCQVDYGNRIAWSIFCNIGQMNWKVVLAVSKEVITKEAQEDAWLFMCVYIVIAVFLFVPVLLIARSITTRVTLLKNKMQEVHQAPPMKLESDKCADEIGSLTESYNYMVEQIQNLLAERIKISRENNQMEMNLLRSQINPHFLYNTLDMISWFAEKGDTESVTDSIQTLAKFYRLSLNQGEILTTLSREIHLLEQYIKLQKRRVLCEISLFVDIPEVMMEMQIPQFLLQPLVENSLKHGILEKEEPEGIITVTGWLQEDEMVLVLYDDGVGMTQEQLEKVIEKKDDPEQLKEGHMGVWNIYRRLQLFYGKNGFSMTYSSQPGEGTQVEMHMSYHLLAEEFLNE